MGSRPRNRLLEQLDAAKLRVGEIGPAQLNKLLQSLGRQIFPDAQSLARFHDGLVFLRAFPPNRTVLRRVESLLTSFSQRIGHLLGQGIDLSILDEEELAGIAGTTLSGVWNYDEVAWLVDRFPKAVSIDWEGCDKPERLAAALPRFVPLLEEDAWVEADVPYRRWLQTASRGPARWNCLSAGNWQTHEQRAHWASAQCGRFSTTAVRLSDATTSRSPTS